MMLRLQATAIQSTADLDKTDSRNEYQRASRSGTQENDLSWILKALRRYCRWDPRAFDRPLPRPLFYSSNRTAARLGLLIVFLMPRLGRRLRGYAAHGDRTDKFWRRLTAAPGKADRIVSAGPSAAPPAGHPWTRTTRPYRQAAPRARERTEHSRSDTAVPPSASHRTE
jgi:hypothetical protein